MKNREIIEKSFKPRKSDRKTSTCWKNFLNDIGTDSKLLWYPSAGYRFSVIDIESSLTQDVYVFTDQPAPSEVYSFIINADTVRVYTAAEKDIHIEDICELETSPKIESPFWSKVIISIKNNDSLSHYEDEYNSRIQKPSRPIDHILVPKSFHEIVKVIKKDVKSDFIGQSFLMKLGVSESGSLDTKTRYVLYMFADDKYFQETFIENLRLECITI